MAKFTLIPLPKNVWLDLNGKLLPGARLYSWLAGTTTPAPLFTDSTGTVPHENPAIADGSGRLTAYMPSNTTYKLELRTSTDASVWVQDGVQGVPSNEVDLDIEGIAGEALADRDVVFLANGSGGTIAGRWYKGDADLVDRSTGANILGIAPQAIASGASGTVRQQGKVDGYSGLTPGAAYYISQVAGQITAVAPPNARFIGIADSTTSLVMSVAGVAQAQPADPIFNSVRISSTNASALDVAGGIVAGTGNVQIVDATGKIPAIDSTRFANLSGASLTGILESAIADGTLLARVSSAETIAAPWVFTANPTLQSVTPQLSFNETDAPLNAKNWFLAASGGVFSLGATEDSPVSFPRVFEVTRSGVTPTGLTLYVPLAGTRINSHSAQPGFLAFRSSNQVHSGGGVLTVVCDTEVYDETGAYNPGTGRFTALVAGRYVFSAGVSVLISGGGAITFEILTSNRAYRIGLLQGSANTQFAGDSVTVDMDAGDTAEIAVSAVAISGNIIGIGGTAVTWFSGRLLA